MLNKKKTTTPDLPAMSLELTSKLFSGEFDPPTASITLKGIPPSANQVLAAAKHSRGFGAAIEKNARKEVREAAFSWLNDHHIGGEFANIALYKAGLGYTISDYYWGNLWQIGKRSTIPSELDAKGREISGRGYNIKCSELKEPQERNDLYEHRWPPNLPLVTTHGIIILEIYYPDRIARDTHNTWFKALVDGLTDSGFFHDDCIISAVYPICMGVDKINPRYVIKLYDLSHIAAHPYILPQSTTARVLPHRSAAKNPKRTPKNDTQNTKRTTVKRRGKPNKDGEQMAV